MELRNHLQTALACPLPSTLIFKYPCIEALAEGIAGQLFPAAEASEEALKAELAELETLLAGGGP